MLEQRPHQPAAASHEDHAAGVGLQLGDLRRDVARDHRRVPPLGIGEGCRDDDLRVVVEPVGELTLARRPCCGEPLVGDPAEEVHLGLHQLVQLELVAVVAAVVLEGPGAVLVVLGPAGILEHTVHRNELRHHQLAHRPSPVLRAAPKTGAGARTHRSSRLHVSGAERTK